jgi:hypothetical protein
LGCYSYSEPFARYADAQLDVKDNTYTQQRVYDREGRVIGGQAPSFEQNLDTTERQFREHTVPIGGAATARDFYEDTGSRFSGYTAEFQRAQPAEEVRVERTTRTTVDAPKHKRDMGYYDDEGQYHSFRRGVQRVAERIAHPIHGPSLRHHRDHHEKHDSAPASIHEEVVVKDKEISVSAPREKRPSSTVSHCPKPAREMSCLNINTVTIPCHHIRIGDLLILQGRPCQVIRITTSSQTGQHRYLGVDLFTKQLHEESSFISNPAPSVVVQNMLGPVFKQYRVLDIRDDGRIVAMTEGGDVKQGIPVLDQSSLLERVGESFDSGRGAIRVLVINDGGRELVVDYRVVHGSRL